MKLSPEENKFQYTHLKKITRRSLSQFKSSKLLHIDQASTTPAQPGVIVYLCDAGIKCSFTCDINRRLAELPFEDGNRSISKFFYVPIQNYHDRLIYRDRMRFYLKCRRCDAAGLTPVIA